jgi:hypothetical protein
MIKAPITRAGALDVADFLRDYVEDNASKAHVTNPQEWLEVADALLALTNDTDAIVLREDLAAAEDAPLIEYRVVWQQCPHNRHPKNVLFVKAASSDEATAFVNSHIERRHGIEWFSIHSVDKAPTLPRGQVVSDGAVP